jgi:competence protein ComGD
MTRNQKGFTLVESLLVLSIFMIISFITAFSLQPQQSVLEDEAFITQLRADLLYGQQFAIAHQEEVTIIILPSKHKYNLSIQGRFPPIIERSFSTNISLSEGSIPLSFSFLPNGNINKFGSFFIKTKENEYRMTFLIGKGRFYVTEQ